MYGITLRNTVLAIYLAAVRPWSVTLAHVCRTQGVTCKVAQEPLHRFLYCRSPFFLPRGTRAFTVFSLCSANCNEKIAAPRLTRVTNATKICRTSLVARYAAPPCVTRYAATYIASTVMPMYWVSKGSTVYLHVLKIYVKKNPPARKKNVHVSRTTHLF